MEIIITSRAFEGLEESFLYLSTVELVSPRILENIRNRIIAKIQLLEINPQLGQLEPSLLKLNKSHRRLIEGTYKIIYRVEDQKIYITDIFDSRQDPKKMKH
ncbi:MAG: type II toxin-antitoxin system RelE/ParE family toxin [Cyclobacteriaceae bacterium]|nr:type II toxin-antitoxin system RelE/ParE family toxin [Cyclobacteriaceae bacterium]